MKIQLNNTLPFTPVQLNTSHAVPRRTVGQVHGIDQGKEYRLPVYKFRHDNQGHIQYQVDLSEKFFIGEDVASSADEVEASNSTASDTADLVWIEHNENLNYKPYAFVVMDAMTRLMGRWDGVVYRTPRGERLHESALQATLQIVDACVCPRNGLWVMVSMAGESAGASLNGKGFSQMGWVPVAC